MAALESLAIVMTMVLLTTFDPGEALQCRFCNSLTNVNCWDNMADVELTDCGGTIEIPTFDKTSTSYESMPPPTHETMVPSPTPTTPASSTEPVSSTEPAPSTKPASSTESHARKRRQVTSADPKYMCYSVIYKYGDHDVIERGCAPKTTTCKQIEIDSGGKPAKCISCENNDCNGSASSGIGHGFFFILALAALIAVFRW